MMMMMMISHVFGLFSFSWCSVEIQLRKLTTKMIYDALIAAAAIDTFC
jgi:Na+/H+ antiporter NhaA